MGSRFVEKIMPSTGDSGPFQSPEKPILAWFQFVPALVTDVIINPFNVNYESDQDLYAILVKPHEKDAFGGSMNVDAFSAEKYSFLVLNKNVVDIATGQGENVNFDVGAVYNEESGRTSKKVIDNVATIRTGPGTVGTSRETSIIITGQMSGAVYVLPVKVNYIDNTPT